MPFHRPPRLRQAYSFSVAVITISLLSIFASAHETWVLPRKFQIEPNEIVKLDLTSGMKYPENDTPIKPERIESARMRLGQKWSEKLAVSADTESLIVEAAPEQNGIATIVIELKPKDIELTDDVVTEYFEEINAAPEVRKQWNNDQGNFPWKEVYTKNAKTLFAVGEIGNDESWKQPTGTSFELVPISNPFQFKAGDTFEIQLQANNKPVPSFPIGLISEGASNRTFATTDKLGVAKFQIDSASKILFYAVILQYQGKGNWKSNFATISLQIQ